MAQYKRILLKLSGESLMGGKQYGIDEVRLNEYATQIKEIAELKMPDLNAASVEAAMSMIAGTARSMGVVVGE